MQMREESRALFPELMALDSSSRDDELTSQAEWEDYLDLVRLFVRHVMSKK